MLAFYKDLTHTHFMKSDEKLTTIDYITLGFIAFLTVILILNWNFLPTAELDTPYHLLMGKMFADYDTVMLWDYYEYAPIGRPNLYPPLEHILIWWLHDLTGVDYWNIGRFISLIQYPLPLLTVWVFSRKLFNPVTALASVVVLSVNLEFWFWQVSVAPTALIVSLFPLFLYSFYRKKVIISIVLLTSFLYLHLGLPYVVILSVFIFSVLSLHKTTEYIKQFAVVTGLSVVLFLPWTIHILMYRDWLNLGHHRLFDPLSLVLGVNILIILFLVIGILKCVEKARIDLKYILVLSAFIGFLAVAVYGWRYNTHSPIINCVVAGIGFETVYSKIRKSTSRKKVAAGFLLLLIPLGAFSVFLTYSPSHAQPNPPKAPQNPQMQVPPHQLQQQQPPPQQQLQQLPPQKPQKPQKQPLSTERPLFHIQSSPLLEMLKALRTGKRPPRTWQITNPEIDELIQWIRYNTSEDEILHMESGMLADYLALFTDRKTDSGMYREVTTPELLLAVREGKKSGIFILEQEKIREQGTMPGMNILEQFGNLLVIQGMKPEQVPHDIPFHLDDLFILIEHPDTHIINQWLTILREITPHRVYIGVRQKDVENPHIQTLINEVTPFSKVGLSIIVEDPAHIPHVSVPVTTLRVVVPREKITYELIESIRHALDPSINLEISILGSPLSKRGDLETLARITPLVDRVVRHVPPNVEFIHAVSEEQHTAGEKFFIQIDTYRGEFELNPDELYMLLQAAHRMAKNNIIIEFKFPPTSPQLLDFLKRVYAV
ncbi:MAG: hypothetical protein AYK18_01705 [Theionarchaea archaeon DG-70]|nr:MAG: hypothetical protein AYK18_01705 [Theionarchaea archaeon DG-70]